MGFLDKVKEKAKQLKDENRNMGTTMKRINNPGTLFGMINPMSAFVERNENVHFSKGSYVSIENEKGVIYGAAQDDYIFSGSDVTLFECHGDGKDIKVGKDTKHTKRYAIAFKDHKVAVADIIADKLDTFKSTLKIQETPAKK